MPKHMRCSKRSSKREVYSNKHLHKKEKERYQINNPTLQRKLENEKIKTKVRRVKEITKIEWK